MAKENEKVAFLSGDRPGGQFNVGNRPYAKLEEQKKCCFGWSKTKICCCTCLGILAALILVVCLMLFVFDVGDKSGEVLPGFPAVPPDATVRTVKVPKPAENPWREAREREGKKTKPVKTKQAKFYNSDEENAKTNGGGDESVDSSPDSSSSDSDSSDSSSESDAEVAAAVAPKKVKEKKKPAAKPASKRAEAKPKPKAKPASETSSSSSSDDSENYDDPKTSASAKPAKKPPAPPASNLSLLLDLEEIPPSQGDAATPASMKTTITPRECSFCQYYHLLWKLVSEALNTSEVGDETVVVARERKIVTKKLQLEDPANVPSNFID